jgi:alpha-D-xyloside xylohydrolase
MDLETYLAAQSGDVLWKALRCDSVQSAAKEPVLTLQFAAYTLERDAEGKWGWTRDPERVRQERFSCSVSQENSATLRLRWMGGSDEVDSPMLAKPWTGRPLEVTGSAPDWQVTCEGREILRLGTTVRLPAAECWSNLLPEAEPELTLELFSASGNGPKLAAADRFVPGKWNSVSLGLLEREGRIIRTVFSWHAAPGEHFAGTGERFERMDLAGRSIELINRDALGVNNRKAYKNVPFYLSSSGYACLLHSSAPCHLSLADVSSRAVIGVIEDEALDLFVFLQQTPSAILQAYRDLTGIPPLLPRWSYGTWMARMTYFSAEEVREIGSRLRRDSFPCDVLHLDTGWFREDWKCEWEFSPERFPDPAGLAREMRHDGFHLTLWQTPNIVKGTLHYQEAVDNHYLAPVDQGGGSDSSFAVDLDYGGAIDFSNPEAVTWYQSMLRRLLEMGYAAIKTDFGEEINEDADYRNLPGKLLRNRYALLYQQAAYEVTRAVHGNDAMIWARAGWTGCQRYPVHWGGDCAATWDGMAGSLRGGLHLGLSGFLYWSHDVPGFHGVPSFMNNLPEPELYLRWTQFGVFSSHLRYHGTSPREPWHYSDEVQHIVRQWWHLRYALIPYLERECRDARESGLPFLAAMLLHHPEDPTVWTIDDQFYAGRDLLVAPLLQPGGRRSIYLPAGEWIDFWTGESLEGERWLHDRCWPLDRCPVFARAGARIPFYPDPVAHTGEMQNDRIRELKLDDSFSGWKLIA